jgi:deoxyribodipyrimidine photolyase-related protein
VKPRLILVLGDQLSESLSALRAGDVARDVVVMAEVMAEGTHVPHHPQKIAMFLAAMRKFAGVLERTGWRVLYSRLDDAQNRQSIPGELIRRAAETGAGEVIATQPGDWRLVRALEGVPLDLSVLPDDRFLCSQDAFAAWAEGRRELRMEYFYREMRRKTGLMMEGDQPAGGRWNFDAENRKPAGRDMLRAAPLRFDPDAEVQEVLALVEARFPAHFGRLRPFGWAVTREQALQQLEHFAAHVLPRFGAEQDAMLEGEPWLSHSTLSAALNLGLLAPMEICLRVEAEWKAGRAPHRGGGGFHPAGDRLAGVCAVHLGAGRAGLSGAQCPWGRAEAAAGLLGGAHADGLHGRGGGADAGPGLCASYPAADGDGELCAVGGAGPGGGAGLVSGGLCRCAGMGGGAECGGHGASCRWGMLASKPYAASGAYIDRMSDHCRGCGYDVKVKRGAGACPFNLLYWDFLNRHRERFARNPRMGQMYRVWDRMDAGHRAAVLADAAAWLSRLDRGEAV